MISAVSASESLLTDLNKTVIIYNMMLYICCWLHEIAKPNNWAISRKRIILTS